MTRVGVFASPDEAREYKQLLNQLRASGFALQGGNKSPAVFEAPQEHIFHNAYAGTVPPFGVMEVTGVQISNNVAVMQTTRPTTSYGRNGTYLFNGPRQVATTIRGVGVRGIVIAAGDANTYATGDRMRVKASTFFVEKHPCGHLVCVGKYELRGEDDIYLCIDVGFPSTIDFVAPGGGIAAATGTTTLTMGSGTCDIWDDAGTAGQISDSGFTETIYNKFEDAVPGGARGKASLGSDGLWRMEEIAVTDLRLSGSSLQYKRGGVWTTWTTGTECP
jgi:hypothetical protein